MSHEQPQDQEISRRSFLAKAGLAVGAILAAELIESCGGTETYSFATKPDWVQDFSSMPNGPIDRNVWNVSTGIKIPNYNNEAEALTGSQQNVRIENGLLVLEGVSEAMPYDGKKYTSARITSKEPFSYGKLEVDMLLPSGDGTWPAAWLLPSSPKYKPSDYGINPNSNDAWSLNGEIDFCEARGDEPNLVTATLHNYDTVKANKDFAAKKVVHKSAEDFHTYGVERTPNKIVFTVDGKPFHTANKTSDDPKRWPFDQSYYLILDLALGGTFGGDIKSEGPWKMDVKSTKFFPLVTHG
jgi:beta-glucanase (GH16 family)